MTERALAVIVIAIFGLLLLWQGAFAEFDFDEFEHVHAAWLLSVGETPYVDFFEEHNFLLWLLIEPIVKWGPGDVSVIHLGRVLAVALSIVSTLLVAAIGRSLFDPTTGLWASALWLATMPVFTRAYEVRPDNVMLPFLLASFWLMVRVPREDRERWRSAAGSGAAWAIGFIALQKAVLFLPAVAVVLIYAERGKSVRAAAHWLAGATFPLLIAGAWLLQRGALGGWWDWAMLYHRTYPHIPASSISGGLADGFHPLARTAASANTLFVFFALLGAALLIGTRRRQGEEPPAGDDLRMRVEAKVLLPVTGLLLVSLLTVRRPFAPYVLPVLTMLAVLAAAGARATVAGLAATDARRRTAVWSIVALMLVAQPIAWLWSTRSFSSSNEIHYRRDAFVRCASAEDDTVLQAGIGFNLYRHDASFFFYTPLPSSRRAASVGLPSEPPFEELVRRERPALITLHAHRIEEIEWLVEEAGYEYEPILQLFVSPAVQHRKTMCAG